MIKGFLLEGNRDMGGIGGFTETYFTEAVIKIEPDFTTRRRIFIGKNYIPPDLPKNRQEELGKLFQRIPSLLGRDIIGQFGLFMHENTRRVFLLKDSEIPDALFNY